MHTIGSQPHTSYMYQSNIVSYVVTQLTTSVALYIPSTNCTFFLCNCLIHNITIIATMMIIMMNNIPPTAPPIVTPTPDVPLLLTSGTVNLKKLLY